MAAISLTFVLSTQGAVAASPLSPHKPILPDAKTAAAVGCAILDGYFPDWTAANKRLGCGANLENQATWVVFKKMTSPGGSPTVELSRVDGRVTRIYMTQ